MPVLPSVISFCTFDTDIILGGEVGEYLPEYMVELGERVLRHNLFDGDISYLRNCVCKREASAVGVARHFFDEFIAVKNNSYTSNECYELNKGNVFISPLSLFCFDILENTLSGISILSKHNTSLFLHTQL